MSHHQIDLSAMTLMVFDCLKNVIKNSGKVACSNDTCLNGGTCLETEWTVGDSTGRNNITCVCPDKYSGSRCQVIIESDNQQGKWSHPQPETSSVHPTPAGTVCFDDKLGRQTLSS